MDEQKFQSSLLRFRKVRDADSMSTFGKASNAVGSKTSAPKPTARQVVPAVPQTTDMKDFWSGLASLLAEHYTAADAKKVSAAFDELHYSSMRCLNGEDSGDLSVMLMMEVRPKDNEA
jgi:hypothetical protein